MTDTASIPTPSWLNDPEAWLAAAVAAVEASIGQLFDDFKRHPFTHRREHSLHVDLYRSLIAAPVLAGRYRIGKSNFSTVLVHKEWPSTEVFSLSGEKKEKRQSYDIGVLSPDELEDVDTNQFSDGDPTAMVAIELGLDYPFSHISGDVGKLRRNRVPFPYVVHFSRVRTRTSKKIEELIEETSRTTNIKTAYAHLDVGKRTWVFKTLDGTEFEQ